MADYWCGYHQKIHSKRVHGKSEPVSQKSVWPNYERYFRDLEQEEEEVEGQESREVIKKPWGYHDRICAAGREKVKKLGKQIHHYTIHHGHREGYRYIMAHQPTEDEDLERLEDTDEDEEGDGKNTAKLHKKPVMLYRIHFRAYPGVLNNLPLGKSIEFDLPHGTCQVFSYNGYVGDVTDIARTLGGGHIQMGMMDAYIVFLKDKMSYQPYPFAFLPFNFCPVSASSAQVITPVSSEMIKYWKSLKITKDHIVIATMYNCKHAYLAVFDFSSKTVFIYDSSWQYIIQKKNKRTDQINSMLSVMDPEFATKPRLSMLINTDTPKGKSSKNYHVERKGWRLFEMLNCAQQPDSHSCCIMVILFVKNIFRFGVSAASHKYNEFASYDVYNLLELCQNERYDMCEKLLLTDENGFRLRRVLGG